MPHQGPETRLEPEQKADPKDLREALVQIAGELLGFMQHHVGDPHLGADIAQDALAQAFQAVERLRDPSALKGWVFRIAINRFNDYVRKNRLVKWDHPELPEQESPRHRRPDSEALTKELDDELRQQLLALPERQRTVLMLHGVRGMTHGDIAQLLGISPDAVKMSLFHAREKMRVRLEKYMGRVPAKRGMQRGKA